jgi:hypothetical protein
MGVVFAVEHGLPVRRCVNAVASDRDVYGKFARCRVFAAITACGSRGLDNLDALAQARNEPRLFAKFSHCCFAR